MQNIKDVKVIPLLQAAFGALRKGFFWLLAKIYGMMLDSVKQASHHIDSIGLVGAVCFPLYYYVWSELFPQPYENLTARMIGSVLCIGLVFYKHWPAVLQKIFPIYWYFTILYSLPFFFVYMLIQNDGSQIWLMSTLIGIFLLILLVDWLSLIVLFVLGVLLAVYYVKYFVGGAGIYQIPMEHVAIFSFAIVSGSIFNYRAEIEKQEKLRGVLSAAGSIAHELRTPLLGIRGGVAGLKRYLPVLFEGYQMAKDHGLPVPSIRTAHYQALFMVLDRIESETGYSNTIIDMLLMNAGKETIDSSHFEKFPMVKCVEVTLARYPFNSEIEKAKVHWDPRGVDFEFWGSDTLLTHVIFNLLKNALYFIAKANKGEVYLWLESDDKFNQLHCKDTGTGIPNNVLPHIFERFYTSTNVGTGIGLSFCQRVMESFGGRIQCSSKHHEFTEFVLSFPKGEPVNVKK